MEEFLATNVSRPYVIPSSPDMAKMLQGLYVTGLNGTYLHFNPSKHTENRDTSLLPHLFNVSKFFNETVQFQTQSDWTGLHTRNGFNTKRVHTQDSGPSIL